MIETITMRIKEASEYLGVSDWFLRELCKQGKIPHIKAGNRYLFRKATIDEWMKQKEEESTKQ